MDLFLGATIALFNVFGTVIVFGLKVPERMSITAGICQILFMLSVYKIMTNK